MSDESQPLAAYTIGLTGGVLTAIGIVTSGPLALLIVALVQAQPPWTGPAAFVENFHRIQALPFYFGFVLLGGSILMLVSIYSLARNRTAALAGLVFATAGATLVFFNYVTQTTFIPALVNDYTADLAPVLSAFSMSNPISITWALEMWGYASIGIGTWFAAAFFGATPLERIAKTLFMLNGIVSVLGAIVIAFDLGGMFSIAALVGYGLWNILYLALAVTFCLVLHRLKTASTPTAT